MNTENNYSDYSNEQREEFINRNKVRLKAILERLGWTEEKVFKIYNTNSKAALVFLKQQNSQVVVEEEPALPASCANKHTVILAQDELRTVTHNDNATVPQTFSDLQSNFTSEQKLKIYEYVVALTGKCTEPEIPLPGCDNSSSFAEIVAAKKREKKKRRRYRTSKPTHIEEVRGLVELQMQALQQYLGVNVNDDNQSSFGEKDNAPADHRHTYYRQQGPQHTRSYRNTQNESAGDSYKVQNRYSGRDVGRKRTRSKSCERRNSSRSRINQRERTKSKERYYSNKSNYEYRNRRSKSGSRTRNPHRNRQHGSRHSRDRSRDKRYESSKSRDERINHSRSERTYERNSRRSRSRSRHYESRNKRKSPHSRRRSKTRSTSRSREINTSRFDRNNIKLETGARNDCFKNKVSNNEIKCSDTRAERVRIKKERSSSAEEARDRGSERIHIKQGRSGSSRDRERVQIKQERRSPSENGTSRNRKESESRSRLRYERRSRSRSKSARRNRR